MRKQEEKKMTKAEAGRLGGRAKVKKGFASKSREELLEISSKGGRNRWENWRSENNK